MKFLIMVQRGNGILKPYGYAEGMNEERVAKKLGLTGPVRMVYHKRGINARIYLSPLHEVRLSRTLGNLLKAKLPSPVEEVGCSQSITI